LIRFYHQCRGRRNSNFIRRTPSIVKSRPFPELLMLSDLEVRVPRMEAVALEKLAAREKIG